MEWRRDGYVVTDDRSRVDADVVEALLRTSYWAAHRPRETIARTIANSVCFSLYDGEGQQVGFARVVSDYVSFAWIADVMIAEGHRGSGLGKWLMECLMVHPSTDTLQQMLRTQDAHALYERFGFEQVEAMSRRRED